MNSIIVGLVLSIVTVLWIWNEFSSDPDPTFQMVSDPDLDST